MGTKNRAQDQNRRRQKAAAKAKNRASRSRSKVHISNRTIADMAAEMFPDDQWQYWASHGVNYLLSDLDTGTWTPMFETIYEGAQIEPNGIAHSLIAKYGPDNDSWTPEAKAALAWVAQSREVGFIYKTECVKRLEADGDKEPETTARLPYNGTVWGVFHELKQKLLARKSI